MILRKKRLWIEKIRAELEKENMRIIKIIPINKEPYFIIRIKYLEQPPILSFFIKKRLFKVNEKTTDNPQDLINSIKEFYNEN